MSDTYKAIASFYNTIFNERPDFEVVHELLTKHGVTSGNLLDLGCGTAAANRIFGKSFRYTGVDLSYAMLEQGRYENSSPLIQARIEQLPFRGSFDAVLCLYDTVNHLSSKSDLEACLQEVSSILTPGGVFIFDCNTRLKIDRYIEESPFLDVIEDELSFLSVEELSEDRISIEVHYFEHLESGLYERHITHIEELFFEEAYIREALEPLFSEVHLYDDHGEAELELAENFYFVCVR